VTQKPKKHILFTILKKEFTIWQNFTREKKNKRTNTASSWAPYLGNAPQPGLSATLKSFPQ